MKDLIERLRNGYPSKERLEAADAIHALNTENTRLTECLRIANNNHEEFERKWYLATDENAQLKAELAAMLEQKPVGTTAAQRVTIAEEFANHDWVDDYLNSIAGVIKAAEAVMGATPAPTENLSTREAGWKQAVMLAYGHLWHTNNEPMAPIPLRSPEKAAYEARKLLREMLTHTERGEAINQVADLLATAKE